MYSNEFGLTSCQKITELVLLLHEEGSSISYDYAALYSHHVYSGTNGYVVRNLSHVRPREAQQDIHKFDQGPPKHREPDEGILEHERLRKIEIRCLELQLKLEDEKYVIIAHT